MVLIHGVLWASEAEDVVEDELSMRVTNNSHGHVVHVVATRHIVVVSDPPIIHYICPPSSPDCSLTFVSDRNMYKASPLLLFSPSRPDIQP